MHRKSQIDKYGCWHDYETELIEGGIMHVSGDANNYLIHSVLTKDLLDSMDVDQLASTLETVNLQVDQLAAYVNSRIQSLIEKG